MLRRLGETAFRYKWWVIIGWVVLACAAGLLASRNFQPIKSDVSIPGTQAQQALDRFGELFPEVGARSGRVVVAAPSGRTVDDYRSQVQALTSSLGRIDGVTTAVSPFDNPAAVSSDRTIAYVTAQIKAPDGQLSAAAYDGVEAATASARTDGLQAEIGGDLVNRSPGEFIGPGEIGGVVVALLVLLITFGTLLAAGLPILTALFGVGASMAGLFALSRVIDINSTTPALAVMLGLAVGIDYSLFIINRYRNYLADNVPMRQAAGRAIATAGNAVLFAATTVVIALSALAVVRIPFMTTMGLAAAGTVALAAIISVTLVPAMLGVVGHRIFGRRARRRIKEHHAAGVAEQIAEQSVWYRIGAGILRFRAIILVGLLAVIAVMAIPAKDLRLGLPTDEFAASDTTQRKAYALLERGFGAGFNGPLLVVVEGLPRANESDRAAIREQALARYNQQVEAAQLEAQKRFAAASAQATTPQARAALQQQVAAARAQGAAQQQAALAQIEQQVSRYVDYRQLGLVADRIAKLENVAVATPALVTDGGTKGIVQVVPKSGPSDDKTSELVAYLRDSANQRELTTLDDATLAVTGTTPLQIDINHKLADALPLYLGVVVGLSFILLLVAFKSILIPVKATLGFLLSVLAMFGALVAVFQWGWLDLASAPGPIVSFMPIIAIGILFGLAMDYEFFLVTGMQEAHHHGAKARDAILRGFSLGSRVVVAAGLIMVAVFAGFITNHDTIIQAFGFALAVGILVDAFLVRLVLTPILMSYLGRSAWWIPRWLARILPKVSIEGND